MTLKTAYDAENARIRSFTQSGGWLTDMYDLPQPFYRIGIKCRVHAYNGTLFYDSLRDDQPIKRIAMMKR
jgi:hypothetical protein